MKYIIVAGGVMSGIGKGIVTSTIGAILRDCDVAVTAIKIDPYLNVDAGTFSPYEHGEVFVLNDGCEVDLDLGNYERFLDTDLSSRNSITTGKIYQQEIQRERQGVYLGATVRLVPHLTSAIQERIEEAANITLSGIQPEVCIVELGGTIGDIEGRPFFEALRCLKGRVGGGNFCLCLVSPIICQGPCREFKTKPTQAAIGILRSYGIDPDMIVCRCEIPVTQDVMNKISFLSDVKVSRIFNLTDLDTIYRVPIELEQQGFIQSISECLKFNLHTRSGLRQWKEISEVAVKAKLCIDVALVGKYTKLRDSYASVLKALEHASYEIKAKPRIKLIESTRLENDDMHAWEELKTSHCLIVPGGFDLRGVEGKIKAIQWARESQTPFLGICLGFQMAVIEYARNIIGIKEAHSSEFDAELKEKKINYEPIVIEMLEYKDPEEKMGGTMRLGLRQTRFCTRESILRKLYGDKDVIEERHRHRYEINPDHIEAIEEAGMRFVGKNDDGSRMEILELSPDIHPYFVGVQYHPEYLSRPFRPSPPYKGLIRAARKVADKTIC